MESTAYFHRIYGIVPWNPLNFHGINGKNLWHFMNFHNFLLLVHLLSTAMETLKTPSEYSVDFNRRYQGFSMANLEKGMYIELVPIILNSMNHLNEPVLFSTQHMFKLMDKKIITQNFCLSGPMIWRTPACKLYMNFMEYILSLGKPTNRR